jgi:hypothetical protein
MLTLELDRDVPNLGKFSACRRVARSIYIGSAPLAKTAHRGLEDRHVKLGCVMPGESLAVFGDALRWLAGVATRTARVIGIRRSRRLRSWRRIGPSSSIATRTRSSRSWRSGSARAWNRRAPSAQ